MAGARQRVWLRVEAELRHNQLYWMDLRAVDIVGNLRALTGCDWMSEPASVVREVLGLMRRLRTEFDVMVADPRAEGWNCLDTFLRGQAGLTLNDVLPLA